jgi:hypothetical protein
MRRGLAALLYGGELYKAFFLQTAQRTQIDAPVARQLQCRNQRRQRIASTRTVQVA